MASGWASVASCRRHLACARERRGVGGMCGGRARSVCAGRVCAGACAGRVPWCTHARGGGMWGREREAHPRQELRARTSQRLAQRGRGAAIGIEERRGIADGREKTTGGAGRREEPRGAKPPDVPVLEVRHLP